jgi:hypothetical protein
MSGSRLERCCPPTEPCPECLAYYAWLNRGKPQTARTLITSRRLRIRISRLLAGRTRGRDPHSASRWQSIDIEGRHNHKQASHTIPHYLPGLDRGALHGVRDVPLHDVQTLRAA